MHIYLQDTRLCRTLHDAETPSGTRVATEKSLVRSGGHRPTADRRVPGNKRAAHPWYAQAQAIRDATSAPFHHPQQEASPVDWSGPGHPPGGLVDPPPSSTNRDRTRLDKVSAPSSACPGIPTSVSSVSFSPRSHTSWTCMTPLLT